MTSCCQSVLGLTALLLQIKLEPVVSDFQMRVHDGFGNDTVGLMYYGGTVEFRCRCNVIGCGDRSRYTLDLTINHQTLLSMKDHDNHDVASFHVKIDGKFKFGSYRCSLDNQEIGGSINISYHLCRDDELMCMQSCCPNPKNCPERLCIVRQPGVPGTCSKLNWTECNFHNEDRICFENNPRSSHYSLCHALTISNNGSNVPIATTLSYCPDDEKIYFVDQVDGVIGLGSYYHYHPDRRTNLALICDPQPSNASDFGPIRIMEKGIGENIILWSDKIRCNETIPFEKHKHSRSKVWGAKTKLIADGKPRTSITSTYIYVISMELVLEFDLPKGPCAPNSTVNSFSCAIKIPSVVPNKSFRKFTLLWFNDRLMGSVDGQNAFRNFNPVSSGVYVCAGRIEHRTCGISSLYSFENNESVTLHQSCLPKGEIETIIVTQTHPIPTTPTVTNIVTKETTEKSPPAVLYSLIALCTLLVFVAAITICFLSYRKWKRSQREAILLQTLDIANWENQGHVLLSAAIKDMILNLMKDDFKPAKEYVEKWFGTFEKDLQGSLRSGSAVPVKGSRFENIWCCVKSQIGGMHMNVLKDFRCNRLYIAMAPVRNEFVPFWEAILAAKIGTIVWVGPLVENNITMMSEYVSTIEGCTKSFKDPSRNDFISHVRTLSVLTHDKYAIYSTKAQIVGPSRKVTGYITVIHLLEWPKSEIPNSTQAMHFCQMCSVIESYQQKRWAWPGLLFQCSTGIESSTAMVALYICRQIYLERQHVNLLGVIKYIRAARFGAFVYGPNAHMQVPIALSCLLALDKTVQEQIVAAKDDKVSFSQKSIFSGSKIQSSNGSGRVDVFRSNSKSDQPKVAAKRSQKLSLPASVTDTGAKKSSKEQPQKSFKAG